MTASNFKPALSLVLAHEGGYSDHPRDPGGATMRGVTQRVYDAYRRLAGQPIQSVRNISAKEIETIYRRQYWNAVRGDDLPAGLDYAVFDFAVNSGVKRANQFIQTVVGLKGDDVDGILGGISLSKIFEAAANNEEALIIDLCDARLHFVKGLSTFSVFGKGWTRRIVGDQLGVQEHDFGVVDYAIKFAKRDNVYEMPRAIGVKTGEFAAKAIEPVPYNQAKQTGWGV